MKRTLLAATVLAAVGAGAQHAAAGDITILFWPGAGEAAGMEAMIEEYNATQGQEDGVTAEVIYFSRDGFFEKMLTDLSAGSTDFDLNLVTTYSLGRYAPFLAPVGDFVSDEANTVYSEAGLSTMVHDDKLFGVPTDTSVHFMYYRSDLIDELLSNADWQARYGDVSEEHLGQRLTPKAPDDWAWDDYVATSLFFTQAINPDSPTRFGTVLQMKNLLFNMMIWQSTMVSNGVQWLDADGNVTIDSAQARQGLDLYKTLYDLGATPGGSINFEYGDANAAFGSGQTATMMQWSAAAQEMNDAEANPAVAGKVGLAPLPAGSEGHRTHVHSLGLGLNANSENKEDAAKFLNWMSTMNAMEIYARNGGLPPSPPILNGMADERPEFPLVGQYTADYGYVVRGGTTDYALGIYTTMAEKFTAYWTGETDADTALAEVAAEIEAAKAN